MSKFSVDCDIVNCQLNMPNLLYQSRIEFHFIHFHTPRQSCNYVHLISCIACKQLIEYYIGISKNQHLICTNVVIISLNYWSARNIFHEKKNAQKPNDRPQPSSKIVEAEWGCIYEGINLANLSSVGLWKKITFLFERFSCMNEIFKCAWIV